MIRRYSSRRESLSDSFLNKKLKNAKSYDRIAGYFSSSVLEVAGEDLSGVQGNVRIICNSSLDLRDVETAKVADAALRKEWCDFKPEELPDSSKRFKQLYEYLSSGKLEVRVLPNESFGLIHGKAGIITLADGNRTSFLGSTNETLHGWKLNYELIWEDDSEDAVKWVQEEFDALWNDKNAIPLSDFIINDIKRISERMPIDDIKEWRENPDPASVAVESPVYREFTGLWEHQKYFVDKAFSDHKRSYGARYILADQVGLGKTLQLAMSAQLMAIYGEGRVLIIVPKTLTWQWQEELRDLLDMPTAVWDNGKWIDENGIEHIGKKIMQCPRKVGIISQGLIVAKSASVEDLLNQNYECIIVDECHRARRKNAGEGKEHLKAEPNNLYSFLLQASIKTKSILLATATPMQMYPIELWDLMNILSQKNDSVLGSKASNWRKSSQILKSLNIIMDKYELNFYDQSNWDWIRNPFPPEDEDQMFMRMRFHSNMEEDDFVYRKSYVELDALEHTWIGQLLDRDFFANYNPYIRHVIRREREYLENKVNPETGEPYLDKINVELLGEGDDDSIVLNGYLKDAYYYAEEFCKLLSQRNRGGGFLKTLLLKRIGSSIEAGRRTGYKMLNEWNIYVDEARDEEDLDYEYDKSTGSGIKELTEEETTLLRNFVRALETTEAVDPKYDRVVELLRRERWIDRGTIIFSQYFDTANWIALGLSKEFPEHLIGLYAGGTKSGLFENGIFKARDKETIKTMVRNHEIKILVGTDSASEGLNLQTLGCLINIDLPWNPTRLEQRKGRIQRIGQKYDSIYIYNMRYRDSIEDQVHKRLSQRLKNITNVFGQLPDVLEDVWIDMALGEEEKAMQLIDAIPRKHPFENRYNQGVDYLDWESCTEVLENDVKRKILEQGW